MYKCSFPTLYKMSPMTPYATPHITKCNGIFYYMPPSKLASISYHLLYCYQTSGTNIILSPSLSKYDESYN